MERWETPPTAGPAREDLVARLRARFADLPAESVRRCVDDLWCCCAHLGVRPEARAIERLAASRLTGVLRGARPPDTGGAAASRPRGARPPGASGDLTASPGQARAASRTPIGM